VKRLRVFACSVCKNAWLVGGEDGEIHSLLSTMPSSQSFPCITPLCRGYLVAEKTPPQNFTTREIPLHTFYKCINGFGDPDGRAAELGRFKELLLTKKVVAVRAEKVGQPERVIVKTIILEGGTRLHFDSSAKGACCYYIEEKPSSFVEAFDEHHDSSSKGSSSGGSENRKENGRDSVSITTKSKRDQQRSPANTKPNEQCSSRRVSSVSEGPGVQTDQHPKLGINPDS